MKKMLMIVSMLVLCAVLQLPFTAWANGNSAYGKKCALDEVILADETKNYRSGLIY